MTTAPPGAIAGSSCCASSTGPSVLVAKLASQSCWLQSRAATPALFTCEQ
jgi:hypothetical protein